MDKNVGNPNQFVKKMSFLNFRKNTSMSKERDKGRVHWQRMTQTYLVLDRREEVRQAS